MTGCQYPKFPEFEQNQQKAYLGNGKKPSLRIALFFEFTFTSFCSIKINQFFKRLYTSL